MYVRYDERPLIDTSNPLPSRLSFLCIVQWITTTISLCSASAASAFSSRHKNEAAEKAADLRHKIRLRQPVQGDLEDLLTIGDDETKLVRARAILQGGDSHDGKSLLLFAASHGREDVVDSLLDGIKNEVICTSRELALPTSPDHGVAQQP